MTTGDIDWNRDTDREAASAAAAAAVLPDPLAALGFSRDELLDVTEHEVVDKRDGRVCACGHPMAKHTELDLGYKTKRFCRPVKTKCSCQYPKPVLETADTRPFLRKTLGQREKHALMRGIAGLMAKEDRTFAWLEGWPKCELAGWPVAECEASSGVQPYSVSESGWPRPETEVGTFMLCGAHAEKLIELGMPGASGSVALA